MIRFKLVDSFIRRLEVTRECGNAFGVAQVGIPRRLNSRLVGIVPALQETLLQQAAMRAQRNVPISAKGAALAQLAELKRSGVKRSDQFEVPHRAHPICGRPADTRPSCLIR